MKQRIEAIFLESLSRGNLGSATSEWSIFTFIITMVISRRFAKSSMGLVEDPGGTGLVGHQKVADRIVRVEDG